MVNVKQTNQPIFLKLGFYVAFESLITNPLSDFQK